MARRTNGGAQRARRRPAVKATKKTKFRRVKTLQAFLRAYGKGLDARAHRTEFARRCGTTHAYIVQIAWGFRSASMALAMKIEKASHGLVPADDVRPDLDWNYARSRPAPVEVARA